MKYSSLLLFITISFSAFCQDAANLVKQNTTFAFDLYKNLIKDNPKQNLFLSPYSISEAMAITYGGARENTAHEFNNVLRFSTSQKELHGNFAELKKNLANNLDSISLEVANSIWAQKNYAFVPEYFKLIENTYNAPINFVNFKKNSSRNKAVNTINLWVEKNTNKQIKHLISQQDVNESTRLIMVNAIWFYGEWLKTFDAKNTKPDIFTSVQGEQKTPFLNQKAKTLYYNDDLISAISLPYKGKKQSMIILLPNKDKSLSMLEKNFDAYYLENILKDMTEVNTQLCIPKFNAEYTIDLKTTLQKMGLKDAFSNQADFSGMSIENELKIDKILHKARIEVSEEGTEAAAATAVIMVRKTAYIRQTIFKANHPFIYLIRDESTGTILFMGRLLQIK